jgi:ferrous iron transport protein A
LQTLDTAAPGAPLVIERIDRAGCGETVWRRLHEMGFDEGVDVEVLHRAPLGDPIAVRVGNMTVALRRHEARQIALVEAHAPVALAAE